MAANDNTIICGADFTLNELLLGAIGVDATGKNYVRLYATTNVSGSKAAICGSSAEPMDTEALLKSVFTLDSNGDIAIRTGTA